MDIRNHRVCILNCHVGIRNRQVSIHQQLRLKMVHQRLPNRIDLTHGEDLKDPIEVLFPTGDCILVVLRVEDLRNRISFTLLDDLVLYPGHSPAIYRLVSELLGAYITGQ